MKNPFIIIRSRPMRHLFGFAGLVSIVVLIVCGCKTPFFKFKAKGGEVHGFVVSGVRLDKTNSEWAGRRIYLPDITVYLKKVSTGVLSPKVKTDLDGSFIIPRQAAGKYELIAEANGFVSSATPVVVSIVSSTVYPQPVPIVPKLSVVFGKAKLKDQRPGRYINAPLGACRT